MTHIIRTLIDTVEDAEYCYKAAKMCTDPEGKRIFKEIATQYLGCFDRILSYYHKKIAEKGPDEASYEWCKYFKSKAEEIKIGLTEI